MTLKEIRPVFYTTNVKETIAFYTGKLGFTCIAGSDEESWASLRRNDVELMITLPNEHLAFQSPIFTGSIYIITENVEVIWNELKYNVKVCYPLEVFDYGMKEFAIYDNNGYLLQFGEEVNAAEI